MKVQTSVLAMVLLVAGMCSAASAQKVKDIQEGSAAPPASLKIDGKNKEWEGRFLAQNKKAGLAYTISNDEKNLYFVFQSLTPEENARLVAGGITIALNTDGSKKEKESITLTYPVIPAITTRQYIALLTAATRNIPAEKKDSTLSAALQNQLHGAKEIHISRFRQLPDSIVSMYNLHGLKAYAAITERHLFFYEVAIPLNLLGLNKADAKEFSYNIKVNGLPAAFTGNRLPGAQGGGNFGGGNFGGRQGGMTITPPAGAANNLFSLESLTSPYDFWGKYVLK